MRRPRFSLLSLLLFTLLCGSAVALWLHWPAWRVSARVGHRAVALEVSPESRLLLVRNELTNQFELYDLQCTHVHQFPTDLDAFSAKFSKDGSCIEFWPRRDSTEFARRWSIAERDWKPWKRYTPGDIEEPSGDGRWVLSRPQEDFPSSEILRLFDASNGREVKQWTLGHDAVRNVLFDRSSPDTKNIWVEFQDRCERLELPTLRCIQAFPIRWNCVFSPDGRWIAHMSPSTPDILLRDASTGLVKSEITLRLSAGVQLSFSNHGEFLCIADQDGSFGRLLRMSNFENIDLELPSPAKFLSPMRFNKKDSRVFTVTEPRETLWIWESSTGKLLFNGRFESVGIDNDPLLVIDTKFNMMAPPIQEPIATFYSYGSVRFLPELDLIYAEPDAQQGAGFCILARHRPEAWWGVAWLPEFWCTVVFAALFGWNILRGRRGVAA